MIGQFGGQTPLNLAVAPVEDGVPILGTSPVSIDRAEDGRGSPNCSISWVWSSRLGTPWT